MADDPSGSAAAQVEPPIEPRAARRALAHLQAILVGELEEALLGLVQGGETLARCDSWAGAAADHFRAIWPKRSRSLRRARAAIRELQRELPGVTVSLAGVEDRRPGDAPPGGTHTGAGRSNSPRPGQPLTRPPLTVDLIGSKGFPSPDAEHRR